MKRKTVFTLLFAGAFSLSLFASDSEKPAKHPPIDMPENVKAIIESSCIGCHNTDSKNDKAKDKLDFKAFDTLTKVQKISKFQDIAEEVEENEMPPKKFLDRFPDKALTAEQKKVLMAWAKKEAKTLVKEK